MSGVGAILVIVGLAVGIGLKALGMSEDVGLAVGVLLGFVGVVLIGVDLVQTRSGPPSALGSASAFDIPAAPPSAADAPPVPSPPTSPGADPGAIEAIRTAIEHATRQDDGGVSVDLFGDGSRVVSSTTFTINGREVEPEEAAALLPGILAALEGQPLPGAAPGGPWAAVTTSSSVTSLDPGDAPSPVLPNAEAPRTQPAADASGTEPGPADLPARVTLDSIQDVGADASGQHTFSFDPSVSVAGRQPYPMQLTAHVPSAQLPRLVKGASFPATVDPASPGTVVVHWDR